MDAAALPDAAVASASAASDAAARGAPGRVLTLSTAAFTLLFAVWLMFGMLGKPIRAELHLSAGQMYWLGAAAVLSGSLFRLPFGILAERFGGRRMMIALLLWTALPTALVSYAQGFGHLLTLALLFGIAGNSFSVGIAWNAAWFPPARKGLAMGVFGAGNVGASVTKLFGPLLIASLPAAGILGGLLPGGWRAIPLLYAAALIVMAVLVWLGTPTPDRTPGGSRPVRDMLRPLRETRVWRFGLYYVVVFGAYVALSLWLPGYFQDVHGCSLAVAGLLTALFIFPASLLRPFGGWLSDRYGARPVTYAAFIGILLLSIPLALSGAEPFTLPLWLVTTLITLIGVAMGVGKASVYRYIPDYYPHDVGAVGGLVGTLGALGGVVLLPAIGAVEAAGLRSGAFALLAVLVGGCLLWLQVIVAQLKEQERKRAEAARAAAVEAAYAAEDARRLAERRARGEALDAYGNVLQPDTAPVAAIRNAPLAEFIGAAGSDGQALHAKLLRGAWLTLPATESDPIAWLAGWTPPTSGTVCFREREIDGASPDRPVVTADSGLAGWRSVRRNLELACADADVIDADARIAQALARFDVAPLAERFPRDLSAQERLRVACACAHAVQPEVLLLSEPTAGMPTADALAALRALRAIQVQHGLTVLWTTRDAALAAAVAAA